MSRDMKYAVISKYWRFQKVQGYNHGEVANVSFKEDEIAIYPHALFSNLIVSGSVKINMR